MPGGMRVSLAPSATVTPPADQPIARITLLAKSDYLPAALGCVRDLSARHGLVGPAVETLVDAVGQVATNVIRHGFDPGEDGSFDVIIRRRPGAVVVSVEDRALEALGFFFAGIIPELAGGDVLRLQYLNDVDPDLEPQIASDFGRELFHYVVAARPD
jgi:hypothetical protein